MPDSSDILLRTGLWRFGAVPARLTIDGDKLTVTSVDPATAEPNALIVSAYLNRIYATLFGSVITLRIEGNRYRLDFGGPGRSKLSEWRSALEFAGLRVRDRSVHPVAIVLMVVGAALAPYSIAMLVALVGVLTGAIPLDSAP